MRRRTVLALLIWAGLTPALRAQQPATVVYLVRHAEKADDSRDPALSPAGVVRAERLARMLVDAGITQVWSTDFQRTRATAGPIAAQLGLTIAIYDGAKLAELAEQLRSTPGRHLVVGHSNTTPALVRLLGADPGTPIADTEYDRFYVVTLAPGSATGVLLRFPLAP
jgi:broad specificity phosphatase PhoE